jgi:cytochrome c oxidase assembly protein subunit 11
MSAASAPNLPSRSSRNLWVGLLALAVAVGMLGLGYAAVPLYRIFCQATGFGGTPARASEAEASGVKALAGHTISIRFDSNVESGMRWAFNPEHTTQTVQIGARSLALFDARNLTDHPITGAASYNIEPESAARYFTKIQCFCFTQQTLQPHQQVRMPVIFYVNPKLLDDADAAGVTQITLSYTFHPVAAATGGKAT